MRDQERGTERLQCKSRAAVRLHVLLFILLSIASSLIIKKLGFVSAGRMALGDWLVWGTIKPPLF